MKRRQFITLLGGAAAWPLVARAQQPERMRRIGLLLAGTLEGDGETEARLKAFRERLAKLGWIEGRNLALVVRAFAGEGEQVRAYAQELAGLSLDVDSRRQQSCACRDATGGARDANRVRPGRRPGWKRVCLEPCASRRDHHRIYAL